VSSGRDSVRSDTTEPQVKVLGGVFALACPDIGSGSISPPFANANVQYFLNFRCALKVLCDVVRPRAAWLPSYLCGSLLEPLVHNHVPIRFYAVDSSLKLETFAWTDEIRADDLVIVIHYFGFPNREFPASEVKQRGAILVEDASQALFLQQQFPESICILYSPRKFLGVPDSGVMVSARSTGTETALLQEPPNEWWRLAVATVQRRRDFDLTGGANTWFSLFQRVESEFPLGSYAASDLSKMLVSCGTNYGAIRARRRENYMRLLQGLSEYALLPELPADAVPIGFPLRVDRGMRDTVLQRLYGESIYPPVHWRIDGIVPQAFEQSHRLAQTTMTLLCDQRYSLEDMDRQTCEFIAANKC
jgi:hypothetical protein